MADEYPKMLTATINGTVRPLMYPQGHIKTGLIIVSDAEEEKALQGVGVPIPLVEMVGRHVPYPIYSMPLDFGHERRKA